MTTGEKKKRVRRRRRCAAAAADTRVGNNNIIHGRCVRKYQHIIRCVARPLKPVFGFTGTIMLPGLEGVIRDGSNSSSN